MRGKYNINDDTKYNKSTKKQHIRHSHPSSYDISIVT